MPESLFLSADGKARPSAAHAPSTESIADSGSRVGGSNSASGGDGGTVRYMLFSSLLQSVFFLDDHARPSVVSAASSSGSDKGAFEWEPTLLELMQELRASAVECELEARGRHDQRMLSFINQILR